MKKLIFLRFVISIIIFLGACSSSEKTADKNNNDDEGDYVFDEVPAGDSFQIDNEEKDINFNYYVQIGAFTTKKSAQDFAGKSTRFLNEELEIKYEDRTELYAVRIKNNFDSRIEAEKVRNQIRQNEEYADAWIVKEHK